MKSSIYEIFLVIGLMTSIIGCDNEVSMKNKESINKLDIRIDSKVIDKLSDKRIFFGHQSVGMNILDGIEKLEAASGNSLKIIKTKELSTVDGPSFMHAPIGDNDRPDLKMKDFEEILGSSQDKAPDIALLKFCYIDINKTTDVDALFTQYKETMTRLEKKYPQTKFVYVTTPLTVTEPTFRSFVKKLLGKPDNNIARAEFNQKLLDEYGKTGRVFDLARIESTYPNGERASFESNGKLYYSLSPEYASDSGHLNEMGSKIAGKELLEFLAGVQ